MTHGKSTPTVPMVGGSGGSMKSGTGGALRDLLSSVAQQVESHLHPSSTSSSSPRHGHVGRRPSRIRSWIGHDRDKDKDKQGGLTRSRSEDGGDNSLHFTDTSDDEFHLADDRLSLRSSRKTTKNKEKAKERRRDEAHENANANANANLSVVINVEQDSGGAKMHMLPDEIREEETVDTLTGLMGDGFDREVARRILRKYGGDVEKAAGALIEGERGEELVGSLPATQSAGASASTWSAGPTQSQSQTQTQTSTPQTRLDAPSAALAGRPNTPVIDLTLDDDPDLQRAMQESMSTLHSGSQSQMQAYAPSYAQAQAQLQAQSLAQMYAPSQGQGQGQTTNQAQSQPERPVFGPSERPPDPNWAVVPSHVRRFPFVFTTVDFGVASLTIRVVCSKTRATMRVICKT